MQEMQPATFVGTWKLNLAKSKTEGWTPRSQTQVYEDWGGGLGHALFEGTDAQGKPMLVMYVARYDGKAYPFLIRGATVACTMSLTPMEPVDGRTVAFRVLADGRPSLTGTTQIAADGKSLAIIYKTNNMGEPSSAVLVYDKQ